jgi:hypothetical protein
MKILRLFFVCGIAACAFGQIGSSVTRDYNFPPVGLASSETAQINVLNSTSTLNTAGAMAPSCTGTITFVNASGKAIGNPVSFTTTGSQIFSTQLTFNQLGATGLRGEFVASIQVTGSFLPTTSSCALVFSLETFDDSTGATHVYLGNSAAASTGIPRLPVAH